MGVGCSRRDPVAASTAGAVPLSSGKASNSAAPGQVKELCAYAAEVRAQEQRREASSIAVAETVRRSFGKSAELAKATSVDGRMIYVVDGAVPEEEWGRLFESLQGDSFRRTEFARPDTREIRHNIVEYNPERLRNTGLFRSVDCVVQALFPPSAADRRLQVHRIYTNALMFGDAGFAHRDATDPDHVTALLYPNPDWSSELGGETIFYKENGEIADAVQPCPGRLCLFHGSIYHKGCPPSRLFWGSRYTTAFKFSLPAPAPRAG